MRNDNNENIRELFTQSCEMYRHFVELRHQSLGVGGAFTAGLVTLFFQPEVNGRFLISAIALCGILVLGIMCAIDIRLSFLVQFYYECMETYALRLDTSIFGERVRPHGRSVVWKTWITSILISIVCLVGTVAWISGLAHKW